MNLSNFISRVNLLRRGVQYTGETAVCKNRVTGDELHFWGLANGETLLVSRRDRRFVSVQRVSEPLGVATTKYRPAGAVRDLEWGNGERPNRSLTALSGAAANERRHLALLPKE